MEPTMSLPENKKSFEISVKGDTSGQMWTGKFETVCVPNLRQRSQAAVMEKQLNGDLKTLDEDTILYHRMISQLGVRIAAAPDWWIASSGGQDLIDVNIVWDVWKNCVQAENEWREKVWGKPEPKQKEVTSTNAEAAKE